MRYLVFIFSIVLISCAGNERKNYKDSKGSKDENKVEKTKATDSKSVGSQEDNGQEAKANNDLQLKRTDNAQIPVKIEGYVENGAHLEVILDQLGIGKDINPIQSTSANDLGYFEFEGYIPGPGLYQLRFTNGAIHLILTGGTVKVETNIDELTSAYTVEGSPESMALKELYLTLNEFNHRVQKVQDRLNNLPKNKMLKLYDSLDFIYGEIRTEKNAALKSFVERQDTGFAGLLASMYLDPQANTSFLLEQYEQYEKLYPGSKFTKALKSKVEPYEAFALGKIAPDFEAETPKGKTTNLADYRGKVVLLDFWASWCKPCRRANPNLVKTYNRYKNQGFEIFSFSLDDNRDDWVKAIQEDNIEWVQTSDLAGWESGIVQTYNIEKVPTTLLLNREGEIIAKDLSVQDLRDKLSEIML